jgi:hypothetical protein
MEVTVAMNCGRCGKKESRSLSLEEAQTLMDRSEAKTETQENLVTELNELLGDDHPDVIIAIRTADGVYEVKTLDSLCDAPGAKRNKGCKTRVETLVGDIFMTNEAAPKKKSPAKQITAPTPTPVPEEPVQPTA